MGHSQSIKTRCKEGGEVQKSTQVNKLQNCLREGGKAQNYK